MAEPFEIGALCDAVRSLNGFVAFDSYSVHVASLPLIVIQGVVLHNAVIPHRDSPSFPLDSASEPFFFAVLVEKCEQSLALAFSHSLDSFGKRPVDVQRSQGRFWVSADHGVFNQLVCLLGNLQRHGSIFVFMFVGIATSAVLASC